MYVNNLIINFFLVIKTRNDIKKNIEKNCTEICNAKLKIKRLAYNKVNFKLINMKEEEGIYLKELNIYIIKLLNFLWEQPKLTADILIHADINDIKHNLAPFIGNFFYDNFLSPYYIQDNLLYVLAIILKNEINNLQNANDYNIFLSNSCAGYIINELKNKNEIKQFFRKILSKTILTLEFDYSSAKLNFSAPFNIIQKKKEDKIIDGDYDFMDKLNENKIKKNQYFINLNEEYIEKERKNNMDNGQKIYEEYLNIISKEKKYENKKFFESLEIDENLKLSYLNNFYLVFDCISQIVSDLLLNLKTFPFSLKYICKIISILIDKKLPNINIIQKNAFIGQYIFNIIIIPLLCQPSSQGLITECLISENTLDNLDIIGKILQKLISGELFTNEDIYFSGFNAFLVEKMKDILKIYNSIIKIKLPDFIEKYINDELDENFEFNYDELNKEEIFFNKFICFQFDDIVAIIKTLSNNQEYFFKDNKNINLKKTFEKLTSETSDELINDILENREYIISFKNLNLKNKNLKELFIFYISEILINNKYKEFFKLDKNNQTISANYIGASKEQIIKTNIEKVKNCITIILDNYQTLSEKRFLEEKMKDTKSIFEEIKKTAYLANYFINNTIPTKWYLSSLFEYLEKLPKNYIDNDYKLIFDEIETEIDDCINSLNFNLLASFKEKLNFSRNNLDSYITLKKKLKSAKINDQILYFINKEIIPISLYFNHSENIFEIETFNINKLDKGKESLDILISEEKLKNKKRSPLIICKTIKAFTKAFPNLRKYEILQDENILELEKNLDLPKKLNEYFNIIKIYTKKLSPESKKMISDYIEKKIYDYIMCKLYNKIFPKNEEKDDKIYRQCIMLAWTQPKHFIPEDKLFNIDGISQELHENMNNLDRKKSPASKFKYMSKIFKLISDCAIFNRKNLSGVDDYLNILYYLIIKEKPIKLYSNCKYMELFINSNKINKEEGNQLTQFLSICNHICNDNYTVLNNVTQEEYITKCKEAAENDINK